MAIERFPEKQICEIFDKADLLKERLNQVVQKVLPPGTEVSYYRAGGIQTGVIDGNATIVNSGYFSIPVYNIKTGLGYRIGSSCILAVDSQEED